MNRYVWYFNRIRCMSFIEILYRLINYIKVKVEKITYSKELQCNVPNFQINNKFKKRLNEVLGNDVKYLMNIADDFLDGKIKIFENTYKFKKESIRWRMDFDSEVESSLKFWSEINYRDVHKVGNIKNIWEMNRHQVLIPLAVAYRKSGEEKYLDAYTKIISTWVKQNPYKMGVNWTSSLECTFRNISWIVSYYLLYDYINDKNIKNIIEKNMFLHGKYIFNHLSRYSSANNHLIGELLGLYTTALLFNNIKLKKWLRFSEKKLYKQFLIQNYDDGVNKEQSIYYHAYVLEFYMLFFSLIDLQHKKIDKKYLNIISKMTEFLYHCVYKSDKELNIGDCDSGRLFDLDKVNSMEYYNSLIFCGILFDSHKYKLTNKFRIDNRSILLFGKQKVDEFTKKSEVDIEYLSENKIFKNGGYAFLYDKSNKLVFDFGNLGYLTIAAHGHADCLSILLSKNNKSFLIDPGTYIYDYLPKWRYYFKSTKAHNTIQVDDRDQATYGGSFMWNKKFKSKLNNIIQEKNMILLDAQHDGYSKIGVIHRRKVYFYFNKYIVIEDILKADNKEHNYKIHYHFHANCRLEEEKNKLIVKNENEVINMKFYPFSKIKLFSGSTEPIMGWQSYELNDKKSTNTIELQYRGKNTNTYYTLINLDNKDRSMDEVIKYINY
ncbi:alginate lyase family protein [Clostridium novyi]